MRSYSILSVLALCGVVAAQTPPKAIAIGVKEAPTPAAGGRVQTVIVGGFQPAATSGGQPTPQFVFTPESVTAQPGETIRFLFLGNNHSVVQTTMDTPCTPSANGFNTGFKPNTQNDIPNAPTMDFPVKATTPVYMSCLQTTHCGKGMIFTVNPPPEGQPGAHTAFKQVAIKIGNPGLQNAGIQAAAPVAQVASTVSIKPQGVGNAAAPTSPAGPGIVVQGMGRTGSGQTCGCSCLCGGGSGTPPDAGLGSFGGIVGSMPAPPAALKAIAPGSMEGMKRGLVAALISDGYKPPLY